MGDKKQTSITQTPAQKKAADNYARIQAQNKKDTAETKTYTAQNEADIQAGKKQPAKVSEVRTGQDQANERGDTVNIHALDTMNPALLDKAIDKMTGGSQKVYSQKD